jgi:hypothetical protein
MATLSIRACRTKTKPLPGRRGSARPLEEGKRTVRAPRRWLRGLEGHPSPDLERGDPERPAKAGVTVEQADAVPSANGYVQERLS